MRPVIDLTEFPGLACKNPPVTESDPKPDKDVEPWTMTDSTLARVINGDKRRAYLTAALLFVVLAAASAGLTVVAVVFDRRSYGVPIASMLIVAAFLLVAAVVVPLVVFGLHRARKRRWEQRQRECKELAAIAETIKDPALGKLISFNFRLMDRFVAVAIEQARASYLACSVAAAAALLVLLVGAATALTVRGSAGQITVGALATVGTALASYLSVTFLGTFQMTSKQMSYYYGQPLVHCYLLHAEWLGERFEQDADPTNRWAIRHQLIRAVLGAGHNAQNHLLDLQLGGKKSTASSDSLLDQDAARHVLSPTLDVNGRRRG
jgi:Cyanobacterial TRADD-N associated 2-Transmembrane domain